jgi:hypothetical protein
MTKNFNRGRSEALTGIFFRVGDAVEHIKSLPEWRGYSDFDEILFRQGWSDAEKGFDLESTKGFDGKVTSNGFDN